MLSRIELRNKILNQSIINKNQVIASDQEREYTWFEFMELARVFRRLIDSREYKSKFICFFAERNVSSVAIMVACILGDEIFVPIDHEQPRERVLKILEKVGVDSIIEPSLIDFKSDLQNTTRVEVSPNNDTCYVLFTSGSTGSPKAVEITYRNLLNTIEWGLQRFSWDGDDVIGIATKFSFDISLFDVFTSLITSTHFYVLNNINNPTDFLAQIVKKKITSIFSTPSLFVMMNNLNLFAETNIRQIISGGDFFPSNALIEIIERYDYLKVYNIWGPTETTIINTSHQVTAKDLEMIKMKNLVSVGKPSKEMPIIIVNIDVSETLEVLNCKEVGEIVVLGKSVSPGYFNHGDLLEQNRFSDYCGTKAYRTGDIGYLDEENNLFLVGRNNQYLKYQGFRIDPREVEFIADSHPNIVKSVLTIEKLTGGEINLVLLAELKNQRDFEEGEIKYLLRSKLPKYMIPKIIFGVSKIPLSGNGKIDRKKAEQLVSKGALGK
jgi:non-ribosomal peptide synthetase component F